MSRVSWNWLNRSIQERNNWYKIQTDEVIWNCWIKRNWINHDIDYRWTDTKLSKTKLSGLKEGYVMIKIDWILITIKTKPKFMIKIFYFKNTENVTSHHVHRKKSFSPGKRAGKQKQLIESKGRLAMRVTIRFSFHTPHSGPPFFKFDSERAKWGCQKFSGKTF